MLKGTEDPDLVQGALGLFVTLLGQVYFLHCIEGLALSLLDLVDLSIGPLAYDFYFLIIRFFVVYRCC